MQEVSSLSSQILPVSISLSPHHASATFDPENLVSYMPGTTLVTRNRSSSSTVPSLSFWHCLGRSARGRQIEFGDDVPREIPEACWATLSERQRGYRYQRENHEGQSWHGAFF